MNPSQPAKSMVIIAWVAMVAAATPTIILQEIFGKKVSDPLHYGMGAAVAVTGLLISFLWQKVRPLREFFGMLLFFVGVRYLVYVRLDQLPFIQRWLNNPSFNVYMPAEQALNLIATLAMIGFLLILKKRPRAFFLSIGDTNAPVEPMKHFVERPGNWKKFGLICALFISLGTLTFLVIAGHPPLNIVVKALPFLPMVILCAVLNAFTEEVSYKASFLSVLEKPVGKTHALWLMAVFFGFAHFYGIPYGITGVLLATFLGWLLGKSMVETRGMFWAWFIHFLQDVLIFSFLAIGSVKPGG